MNKNKEAKINDIAPNKIFSFDDIIAIGIFTLYILVDFVPIFSSYTFADCQWLYLTVLNFFAGFYIYYNKIWVENILFKSIFLSKTIIFYLIFLLLSGISIAVGLNFDEGFITLLRYLVSFSSLIILFVLFYNKSHTFLTLACIISILIFVECINGLKVFFENYKTMTIEQMRFISSHHHDNINIFSSNILIKVPFIIFCIIKTIGWRRIAFGMILLFSIATLLFLSSRSIIAGLSLQLFLIFVGLSILKFYRKIDLKFNIVLLGFLLVLVGLTTYQLKNINNTRKFFETNTEISNPKVSEITPEIPKSSNLMLGVRINYWIGALATIKEKPLFGCGLGNWKMESMKHELKWKPDNLNAVHAHNDFLEVAAETGIVNGMVYFMIFISLIFVNIKTMFKAKTADQSYFSIVLLAAIIGLMVDSFFNFPLSRPTIQIIFVILILFTILNNFQYENKEKPILDSSLSKNLLFVVLMLSFASIYPNYLIFKFYQGIKIIREDASTLNLSYNQINTIFSDFPSIDETGTPIIDTKVNYLIKENKFKKALQFIDKSTKINPYSVYSTSLRVDVYNKNNQWDSAVFYAKKVYDLQPKYQVFYERYIQGLARIKDTTSIIKAFKKLDVSTLNAQHYVVTFGCLLKAGYNQNKSLEYIKNGLNRFPDDLKLKEISDDFNNKSTKNSSFLTEKELQINASKTNDYRAIEKFYLEKYANNKSDYSTIENLGICYFQQKKYNLAIEYLNKVVVANAFQNGKSEYVMAISYDNLFNKKMACEMANLALQKNYQEAKIIIQKNCN